MPRHRFAALLCSGAAATFSLGGCVDAPPAVTQQKASTPTMTWGPGGTTHTSDVAGRVDPDPTGRKAAPDGTVWHLHTKPHEAPVEDSQWPDADEVFAPSELKAIFPHATGIATGDCAQGRWPGGDDTSHNTKCDITLKAKGTGVPAEVRFAIEGFGADPAMTQRFDAARVGAREIAKQFPDQYTFYRDGAFGAKALYRDGEVVTVLVSDGTIAGQFTLAFRDFDHLVPQDKSSSNDAVQTRVMPLLVETLAAKMPRTR